MPDDADQALERLPLLFAERLTEIREHQQLVRPAALSKQAASDLPSAHASGKRRVDDAGRFAIEAVLETELLCAAPEQTFRRLRQEPGARAVDEGQLPAFVEREHSHFDLRHHLAQQRRRLERIEALVPQRFDERVDFDHDFAERVAAARAARANGEVAFAKRGQQVGQRLKGQDDALAQRKREAETEGADEDGERPLDFRRVIARPEKDQRDERPRQRGCEGHQEDAAIVTQPRFPRLRAGHVNVQC